MKDATGLELRDGDEVVHASYSSSGLWTKKTTVRGFTEKRVKLDNGAYVMGHTLIIITNRRT